MDIDWSKAPEGATHYCKMAAGFRGHGDSICIYCIQRPTKPAQASDWPDGLPPVGLPVEVSYTPQDERWWPKGQVIAYHLEWVIFERKGKARPLIRAYDCVRFRPLKTDAERQREELARVIRESDEMAYSFRPDDIADAILARYNLEPKP